MMRKRLDEELGTLNQRMIRMGMLCESAIRDAADALLTHDLKKAEGVGTLLEEIDTENREIENLCLLLLLQQQPVAGDLRVISAAAKMLTDMHRIGETAEDIAEVVLRNSIPHVPAGLRLKEMSDAAIRMVSESIDAYVKRDVDKARDVIRSDDVVDRYFTENKEQLIRLIRESAASNTNGYEEGEMIIDLLIIIKYLERIGDHAVRIAGWVTFIVTSVREGQEN